MPSMKLLVTKTNKTSAEDWSYTLKFEYRVRENLDENRTAELSKNGLLAFARGFRQLLYKASVKSITETTEIDLQCYFRQKSA